MCERSGTTLSTLADAAVLERDDVVIVSSLSFAQRFHDAVTPIQPASLLSDHESVQRLRRVEEQQERLRGCLDAKMAPSTSSIDSPWFLSLTTRHALSEMRGEQLSLTNIEGDGTPGNPYIL